MLVEIFDISKYNQEGDRDPLRKVCIGKVTYKQLPIKIANVSSLFSLGVINKINPRAF